MTALDEQINQLERERNKIKMQCEEKEAQARKYEEIIKSIEPTLEKMKFNTSKLKSVLDNALSDGF